MNKKKTKKPTETKKAKKGKNLASELQETKDKYLRLYSEFENYRRRTSKEKIEMIDSANKELLKDILPVIDDYVKMYSEKINIDLTEEWDLYSAYNLFKLAGILQGILGRVRDGTAAHENAAERASGVKNLSDTAWALVEKNFI